MKNLLIILAVSAFFRFLYLGVIPVSLSHDETDSIIQAHSVMHTGHDIEGTWSPISLLPNNGVMAELAPLIHLPALSILPNTLFTARLTNALLGTFLPLLIWYWLTLLKTKKYVALSSAYLLAISPWHIIFSRTALEASTSLFLYLISWIFLTKLTSVKKQPKMMLMNLILFGLFYTLGFFTYHGYKFSMPILTGIIIIWQYFSSQNNYVKRVLPVALIILIGLVVRTAMYSEKYASRNSELIFLNTEKYEDTINLERRQSLATPFFQKLYSNKPVKLIEQIRDKYLSAANIDMLYLHGEENGAFSIWKVGYLYLITLPFLLLGLVKMLSSGKREQLLILVLLLISPIATVMHVNNSLVFRSGIYFILLNIITAYGLIYAYESVSDLKTKIRLAIYSIFTILLISSISYFTYVYLFISPVSNANNYFYSDRLIANYLRLSPANKILIITTQPRYLKSAAVLVNPEVSKEDIDSFGSSYSPIEADSYIGEKLTIVRDCPKDDQTNYDTIILEADSQDSLKECAPVKKLISHNQLSNASIVSVVDSGDQYRILGDRLCHDYNLNSYVDPSSLSNFKLEQMSESNFCQSWIVRR